MAAQPNMSWLNTLLIAILSAALGALLGGVVAGLVVDWYRVSSFEGGSSYFVVFSALGGMLGGLLLGIVVARVVATGVTPSLGKGLWYSLMFAAGIAATVAGVSRLRADIPPTLNGEKLMLLVEVRWPASQQVSPGSDPVARALELGAISENTLHVSKSGPLWTEDARREDGRWIVPGAVEVFTNRGTRVIQVQPDLPGATGLALPMNGGPDARHLIWSEWMPRALSEGVPADDGFTYRFKVIPRSQPSRMETVGSFDIDTIAEAFFIEDRPTSRPVTSATAQFAVRHHGNPVAIDVTDDPQEEADGSVPSPQPGRVVASTARMQSIATLPGSPSALLVRVAPPGRPPICHLLVDGGDTVHASRVSRCDDQLVAEPLPNDQAWRDASSSARAVNGLARYYAWQRNAAGVDRLVARTNASPHK